MFICTETRNLYGMYAYLDIRVFNKFHNIFIFKFLIVDTIADVAHFLPFAHLYPLPRPPWALPTLLSVSMGYTSTYMFLIP